MSLTAKPVLDLLVRLGYVSKYWTLCQTYVATHTDARVRRARLRHLELELGHELSTVLGIASLVQDVREYPCVCTCLATYVDHEVQY